MKRGHGQPRSKERTERRAAAALHSGRPAHKALGGFSTQSDRARPPPAAEVGFTRSRSAAYRVQVHVRDGRATVYSRRGFNWTETFASIAEMMPVLDDEAIVQDARGVATRQEQTPYPGVRA
jgi:hypothetical protein